MSKKKAFTLIELLAVIVIMVVILLIFAPDLLKIISKSQTDTYSVKEKLIARAGQDYVLFNNVDLPTQTGEEKLIGINTLISSSFINTIYDLSNPTDECKGYFVAKKNGTYGHTYIACLFCDTYQTDSDECNVERLNMADITTPTIILKGDSTYYLEMGQTYVDPGASAYTSGNVNITKDIVTTGLNFNVNTIGVHTVTYNVTNNGVNAPTVTRTVVVRDTTAPTIAFGTNGDSTPAKTHITVVTGTDLSGISSLKYVWSTSKTAPTDASFVNSFTSGSTVSATDLNGTQYLWIYSKDNNNNTTKIRSNAFTFDNVPPTVASATIVTNNDLNNKQAKNGDTITLNIMFSESISNTPTITIDGRTATINGSETSRTAIYTIPTNESTLAEGTVTFSISNYIDVAGNTGSAVTSVTTGGNATYDRTPPALASFYIGGTGNPAYISSTNTILYFTVTGASDMCISNSPSCNAWQDYSSTMLYTLPSGDGAKTVYAWFRDDADNITSATDTITLDTQAPQGTLVMNSGAAYTTSTAVTLAISATDSLSGNYQMCISNTSSCSSWETYATSKSWTLPSGDGTKTVYIWFKDNIGNISASPLTDTITLDTQAPTGTLVMNSGATYATSTGVTLTISATDASQMCISNTSSCSSWETYATSKSWTLTSGDGTKTVYIWFKDAAGNASIGPSTDTITLDTQAPTGTLVMNSGATYATSTGVTLAISSADASQMCISNTSSCSSWETYATSKSWTLTSGDGTKTVYIWFKDAAGNVSSQSTDTIILDTTPPPAPGYFYIGGSGNPSYITSLSTTLYISDSDASDMCISATTSCSSWGSYSTTKAYTFSSGNDGDTLTLYIWFRDAAGNVTSSYYSDSTLYLPDTSDTYTCGVSGYSSDQMGWSTGTSTVIQGSAVYTNYYGPMYFRNSSTLQSVFADARAEDVNYDIQSIDVKILSHVGYARTVRLFVGGPCPTPDYSNNVISGSNPSPLGGSTNYIETSCSADSWATWHITNAAWISAFLNPSAACLYINRGDSSSSYWEGDGAKDTNKPQITINWAPNP